MRKTWEDYEIDILIELKGEEYSYNDIAEVLGRTRASCEGMARKLIIEGRIEAKKQWTRSEQAQLCRLRKAGKSNSEIAKALGRTQASVEYKVKSLIAKGRLQDQTPTRVRDFLMNMPEEGWMLTDMELAEAIGIIHDSRVNDWRRRWQKGAPITSLQRETLARLYRMGPTSCGDLAIIEERTRNSVWQRMKLMLASKLVTRIPGKPDLYRPHEEAPSAEALATAEAVKG